MRRSLAAEIAPDAAAGARPDNVFVGYPEIADRPRRRRRQQLHSETSSYRPGQRPASGRNVP